MVFFGRAVYSLNDVLAPWDHHQWIGLEEKYILLVLSFIFRYILAILSFIEGENSVIVNVALFVFAESILELHYEDIAVAH